MLSNAHSSAMRTLVQFHNAKESGVSAVLVGGSIAGMRSTG
jgi:hypothetical protein